MEDKNRQYDNRVSNSWMEFVGTLIRIVERSVVTFFDGMRNAVESGTPSMLGFMSAILPLITPAPVAGMTAISLKLFFGWEAWQAWMMAASLEVAGFVLYVSLVETLIEDGWNGTLMQVFFSGSVIVYQFVLIAVNGVLAKIDGANNTTVTVLILLSLLPALGSIQYGYRNSRIEKRSEKQRQEIRQDKKEARREKSSERLELAKSGLLTYQTGTQFTGKHRAKIDVVCHNCKKTFKASSEKAKYCSNACKQSAYRNARK